VSTISAVTLDHSTRLLLFCVDPFADDEGGTSQDGYIHIRIQQRNGRKTLTTVQGISSEFDLKKIVKVAKKVNCADKLFNISLGAL
jgi:translation initiation factor SUI1